MVPNESLIAGVEQTPQQPEQGPILPNFVTYVFDWEDIQSGPPQAIDYYHKAVELEKTIFREVFKEEVDLSKYDEKSIFFLVCHEDQVAGVMRLVWDKDTDLTMSEADAQLVDEGRLKYMNPTLDYIKETPVWNKGLAYILDQAKESNSDIVFGRKTADITSWAIAKDYRRALGASSNGNGSKPSLDYFDNNENMAVNVAFFQQLYNWCMTNDIECVTAVYDDNPLLYMFKMGLLKKIPGLEPGPLGGSKSSTPVYGLTSEWRQVHDENPLLRKFIFSEIYPVIDVKKPEG